MTATSMLPLQPLPQAGNAPGRERVQILGTGIDRVGPREVERTLESFVREGGTHQVVTVNLDFLSVGTRDAAFRQLVNDAELVVADGMPVLWAARYLGSSIDGRTTGPDLIEMAVRHSQRHGSSLFFLGAAEGVAARAAERLRERMGPFALAGAYAPPFGRMSEAEDGKIRRMISDARPEFVFVGFGCPKQDFWIRDHRDLAMPVAAGIGGSFDYLSGAIRRAPAWAQARGLEWAFRLGHEPRRLAKRYLVDDVQVVGKIALSRFRGTQEAPSSGAQEWR